MQAQLTFLNTARAGESIPLDLPVFTIGRAPGNCLVINIPAVSSRHATITRADTSYRLEDTSRNGVRVNSIAMKSRVLADGDVLFFCGAELRVVLRQEETQGATRIIQRTTAAQSAAEHPKTPKHVAPVVHAVATTKPPQPQGEKVSRPRLILYGICGVMLLGMVAYSKLSKIFLKDYERAPAPTASIQTVVPAVETIDATPPADSLAKAEECFQVARHLAKDQTHPQNRYRAGLKWQEGMAVLGQYQQRPVLYDNARMIADSLARVIEERHQQLRKELVIVVKQKDSGTATDILQEIMCLIPNQTDPRYQQASRERAAYRGAGK